MLVSRRKLQDFLRWLTTPESLKKGSHRSFPRLNDSKTRFRSPFSYFLWPLAFIGRWVSFCSFCQIHSNGEKIVHAEETTKGAERTVINITKLLLLIGLTLCWMYVFNQLMQPGQMGKSETKAGGRPLQTRQKGLGLFPCKKKPEVWIKANGKIKVLGSSRPDLQPINSTIKPLKKPVESEQ